MAGPGGVPPSAEMPEGTSRAITGRALALISSIARRVRPEGAPLAPVPSKASTMTSARRRWLVTRSSSSTIRGRIPTRRRSASLRAASPRISDAGEVSHTVGRKPRAVQPARRHESVATVAALPAHDFHPCPAPCAPEKLGNGFGSAPTGVLHEDCTGDPERGGGPRVQPPHLVGREYWAHGLSGRRPGDVVGEVGGCCRSHPSVRSRRGRARGPVPRRHSRTSPEPWRSRRRG